MIIKNQKYYWKIICLLVCLTHTGVGCVYAQEAAARRKRLSINEVSETDIRRNDSIAISDSLALANQRNIKKLSSPVLLADSLKNDSVNFAKNKKTMDTQFGQSNLVGCYFSGRRTDIQQEILETPHYIRRLCRMCLCVELE